VATQESFTPGSTEAYGQSGMRPLDRLRTWLISRSIRRQLGTSGHAVMLDIGCGYFAEHLRANYDLLVEGWGIDQSIAVECKQMPKLRFLEDSVESALPSLPENHFQVILFISVLEHLRDAQAALEHCHRILRPGGILLINVPTWAAKPVLEFSAFTLGTSTPDSIDDHKTYYGKRDLWPLLVCAGFRPRKIRLRYRFLGMTLFGVVGR
jgi:SAM-dependent methyltransferase